MAVRPDGTVATGWPVNLAAAGAAFWSVAAGTDGIAYALAIEPCAGGEPATVLAIGSDDTVLSRATVVEP